jgi:hypothetical protein
MGSSWSLWILSNLAEETRLEIADLLKRCTSKGYRGFESIPHRSIQALSRSMRATYDRRANKERIREDARRYARKHSENTLNLSISVELTGPDDPLSEAVRGIKRINRRSILVGNRFYVYNALSLYRRRSISVQGSYRRSQNERRQAFKCPGLSCSAEPLNTGWRNESRDKVRQRGAMQFCLVQLAGTNPFQIGRFGSRLGVGRMSCSLV